MRKAHSARAFAGFGAVLAFCAACTGCHSAPMFFEDLPRELAKADLPEYVIEPPDVLVIDAVRTVPKPPYRIEPLDALAIVVPETLADQPLSGVFPVAPDGTVDLSFSYGQVRVTGLTLEEARTNIEARLKPILKPGFHLSVALALSRGGQQIRGDHLVRTDGTVVLGIYGPVKVSGLTVPQAKAAVETHLSQFLLKPEVSLDVAGYNSKTYYVITDGGGLGEQVIRLPVTGHDTVLDAISQVNGLSIVSSKKIWLVRPTPVEGGCEEVLPVDWVGITQHGQTATNYQVVPGDRIYIKAEDLVRIDTALARLLAPVERVFGVTLLGASVYRSVNNAGVRSTNGNNGGF
jgi:polysaccharide export outer membrane protein